MTNNINNFDSGLDNQHEGLDIKLNHIIMMLDELLKHVPIDKNTREHFDNMSDSFFGIDELY
jgi:hypothetical protein|tara:strand:- start:250 stop:435 length:186 start_codon:yes stop_codon:yes gene_type:complete